MLFWCSLFVTWLTSPVARPSFPMQAFVQQPGGHQVIHALYSKHCRPNFNAAFDFRGLGCLGMLAKAESGGTVSPPTEGHVRLGSRVPSAGTGMGTWSLLVSARKQGPPEPSLRSRVVKRTGSICRLGWPRPRLTFDNLRMAQHPQQTKLKTRFAGLVRDEFGYAHPLPSFRAESRQVFILPSLVLSVKCFWAPWCRFASTKSLHSGGKTSLSRKVINLCCVLAQVVLLGSLQA